MKTPRLRLPSIALAVCSLLGLAAPAGAQAAPEWPSPEWYQREAANYAMTTQAPAEQASDPAFEQRWIEQTAANREYYMDRVYVKRDWPWMSTGNLCAHWSGPCTGDPFLYPGVDSFYENEGLVSEVIYFDHEGALLSGRVWAPRSAQPGDELPGVVIETGSVQAPETLYWWFAQTLVRNGYVVMTYDVRGQGRSDNRAPNGSMGSNANSNVFVTNLVDSVEFFLSTPDQPYEHVESREAPITAHNPFHDLLDQDRLGIVGHSLGARGVSVVQGIPHAAWPGRSLDRNPVDVAVAWDNLSGSGSLAGFEVEPRVPTMGQSADYGLTPTPYTSPPDPQTKNAGFATWSAAGVPTYQVNVRGGTHYEWSLLPKFPTSSWDWGNPMADHYTLAWLDRWLKESHEPGYGTADFRLLDDASWTDRMSFYFPSARAFPTRSGTWQRCDDIKTGCEPTVESTSLALVVEGSGARRTLVATLTDADGRPLSSKEVAFSADGAALGTAITDGQGRASLAPTGSYRTGRHTYGAEFAGDDTYSGSSAEASR